MALPRMPPRVASAAACPSAAMHADLTGEGPLLCWWGRTSLWIPQSHPRLPAIPWNSAAYSVVRIRLPTSLAVPPVDSAHLLPCPQSWSRITFLSCPCRTAQPSPAALEHLSRTETHPSARESQSGPPWSASLHAHTPPVLSIPSVWCKYKCPFGALWFSL